MKMVDDYTIERFGTLPADVTPSQSQSGVSLLFNTHHVMSVALVAYAYDAAIGIAIGCYALTIGFVVLALRMTHHRNARYSAA
jgi:hypothetical protein